MDQITQLDAQQVLQKIQLMELRGERALSLEWAQAWLTRQPNTPQSFLVWYELGRLLQQSGLSSRAEHAFRVVLEQKPGLHEANLALGATLEAQGKVNEALGLWSAAVQSDDTRIGLLNNIGRVMESAFNFEPAEEALIKSLRTKPHQPDVISTLLHMRARMCRWPVISEELGVSEDDQKASLGPLTALSEFDDPHEVRASSERFILAKAYEKNAVELCERGHFYADHPRLKVGFLSADFRLHATSIFFVAILEKLDRNQFEVHGLDITVSATQIGDMRDRILKGVDHHTVLNGMNDAQAAQAIRDLEIDVLVDLNGLTSGARPGLIARRAAPLQLSYLGFLGSCGLKAVDFIVTTPDLFPENEQSAYSEQAIFLPNAYVSMDPEVEESAALPTRESCGLPPTGFVYCALLNPFKLRPAVFERWLRILKRVPGSVLWLVEENKTARQNLLAFAESRNIPPERLVFAQRVMPQLYRARLKLADVFLDTSPYGNGATAHDALLANLPILTKPGRTMMSRLTAHMMSQMGMPNFIVTNWDEYEDMAVQLGHNPLLMAQEKARMKAARQTSLLFKRDQFVREFGDMVLDAVAKVRLQKACVHGPRKQFETISL